MTSEPTIAAELLTKCYHDNIAVDSLDLQVAEGRILCLLGPNGSGKTTTVGMLTTLRRPTSGRATVCGHDVVREPVAVRALVGVTLQHTGIDDLMTGREMLQLQGILHGLNPTSSRQRVEELIALLDLGTHIDTRLGTWSGGLRRRVDLAAALVHRPRVLFLDEPTTGLDPASRRTMWAEIKRLKSEEGVTVLLTTQHLDEADHLADEVSILANGQLLITAAPEELRENLGERSLTLVFADPESAARAIDVLREGRTIERSDPLTLRFAVERDEPARCVSGLAREGLEVSAMTVTEPSLEDVFLSLTNV